MNKEHDQTHTLLAHLGRLVSEEFYSISGLFNGHSASQVPNPWPEMRHIETMPYYPLLGTLGQHIGDCQQCFEDGDGPTTCEEALVLEVAAKYEADQQFITSLLN